MRNGVDRQCRIALHESALEPRSGTNSTPPAKNSWPSPATRIDQPKAFARRRSQKQLVRVRSMRHSATRRATTMRAHADNVMYEADPQSVVATVAETWSQLKRNVFYAEVARQELPRRCFVDTKVRSKRRRFPFRTTCSIVYPEHRTFWEELKHST